MADKKKRICPRKKCGKENESDDSGIFGACIGCGLDFASFDQRRLLSEAEKDAAEADQAEADKNKPKKPRSILGNL